jgi:hypothetical protein
MCWLEAADKCESLKISQGHCTACHWAKISDLSFINLDSTGTTCVSAKTPTLDPNPNQDERDYYGWEAK